MTTSVANNVYRNLYNLVSAEINIIYTDIVNWLIIFIVIIIIIFFNFINRVTTGSFIVIV